MRPPLQAAKLLLLSCLGILVDTLPLRRKNTQNQIPSPVKVFIRPDARSYLDHKLQDTYSILPLKTDKSWEVLRVRNDYM